MLSANKCRIVTRVLPFTILCVLYAACSTAVLFGSDWEPISKGQLSAGLALQCQVVLMAGREVCVTCYD